MNFTRAGAAGFALTAALGTMAFGQNLKDRIDHVMQQRATAETRNTTKASLLGKLLYTDITVKFSQTPLRDTINYLETVLGISLTGRYNDDRTGIGMDPNTPITLDVTNQPALSVLEMILAQAEDDQPTTWQLREGYVEVGTKERLASANAREIRYYPIRDLLFEPTYFDNAPALDLDAALNQGNTGGGGSGGGSGGGFGGGGSGGGSGGGGSGGSLFSGGGEDPDRPTEAEKADQIIELITETVEPDAWETNGGEYATIRYYSGTLIVRAPDYIHRQLAGYPFAIRPAANVAAGIPSRYVTFTGGASNVELAGIRVSKGIGGAAGGGGGKGGAGGSGGAGSPGSPGSTKDSKSGDGAKKDAAKPKSGSDAGTKDAGKGESARGPK